MLRIGVVGMRGRKKRSLQGGRWTGMGEKSDRPCPLEKKKSRGKGRGLSRKSENARNRIFEWNAVSSITSRQTGRRGFSQDGHERKESKKSASVPSKERMLKRRKKNLESMGD